MKDPLIKTAINTENVFRFWRAIEALAPQNIDKANERDMLNPVYKTGAGGMLPWDAPQHRRKGTVAKLAMRQPFVLFKGLTF
ncbi:hypothetical protein, partial [Klebsiella aerogenes]|uniref:hypothetical protein n=1 Tax=Klebsiella aerogenes TaxID=548 RepID=UPI001F045BC4